MEINVIINTDKSPESQPTKIEIEINTDNIPERQLLPTPKSYTIYNVKTV